MPRSTTSSTKRSTATRASECMRASLYINGVPVARDIEIASPLTSRTRLEATVIVNDGVRHLFGVVELHSDPDLGGGGDDDITDIRGPGFVKFEVEGSPV